MQLYLYLNFLSIKAVVLNNYMYYLKMYLFSCQYHIISGQPTCSLSGIQHYSFDYAQQVHYPHYAQQVGPIFFKTPRRCQCFGVCSEGSGKQIYET